jgi:hypothetical protein
VEICLGLGHVVIRDIKGYRAAVQNENTIFNSSPNTENNDQNTTFIPVFSDTPADLFLHKWREAGLFSCHGNGCSGYGCI